MGSADPCLLPATGQARALRDGRSAPPSSSQAPSRPDRAGEPGGERDRDAASPTTRRSRLAQAADRRPPPDGSPRRCCTACRSRIGPGRHGRCAHHLRLAVVRRPRPRDDALLAGPVREAGAIMLGKTNTPEWGAGSHTFNPVFGATRNPWEPERSAGGSSGGARGRPGRRMVPLADGSDLGGVAAQPGRLERRRGPATHPGRVPDVAATHRRGCRTRSTGRWRARRATWRCCSRRWRAPTGGRRSRSASLRSICAGSLDADRAAAGSPGARRIGGLPVEPAVLDVVTAAVAALGRDRPSTSMRTSPT